MDFNNMLYRPIKPGVEFGRLIPKATCKITKLGNGMTDFSVQKMVEWIEKYAYQANKIAPKFKKSSLKSTVNAIHDFLYWHFQYKADQSDQYIRSLACAWKERTTGIDCKTYSVIASKILLNLNTKHYIRKIKQPGFAPTEFTHVYVIVPINQNTGALDKGYYVIDGTLQNNIEPVFTEKHDTPMLAHYGMNGPGLGRSNSSSSKIPKIKITTNTIKDIFNGKWSPNCIGGTYDRDNTRGLESRLAPFFNNLADNINTAVISNTTSNLHGTNVANAVNEWIRTTQLWVDHATRTVNKPGGWKSRCSRDHVGVVRDAARILNTIGINGLLPWLAQYYDFQLVTQQLPSNQYNFDSGIKKNEYFATIPVQLVSNVIRKQNTPAVVAFEFDQKDLNLAQNNNFNAAPFLATLSNVIQAAQGNPTQGNSAGGWSNQQPLPDPTVKQAGGGILGWILGLAVLGYGVNYFIKKS